MEKPEKDGKMDRRTRYTRQLIRDTLLELMQEKGFQRAFAIRSWSSCRRKASSG